MTRNETPMSSKLQNKFHAQILEIKEAVEFGTQQFNRAEALCAVLRLHRCNSDGRRSVGECVESCICCCSCGILLERPAVAIRGMR